MATTTTYEPGDLDLSRALLTDALLRAPLRPARAEDPLWQLARDFEPRLLAPETNPVAGIATSGGRHGPEVLVLLEAETDLNVEGVAQALNVRYPVRTLVSGPIVPAARPAQGGDSLSGDGPGGDTGTFGCLVRTASNDLLMLGCNHTLAGVNQCTVNHDTVRQPGAGDGGNAAGDTMGTLVTYQTITLGGYHPNTMDAALAEPASDDDVVAGIRGIGAINGVGTPLAYDDRVQKVGWATAHTFGTYLYTLSFTTTFPGSRRALFVDQYGIVGDDESTGFAQRGDSGAAVLTENGAELVALVIGIADRLNMAIASPIEPILSAFGVEPA